MINGNNPSFVDKDTEEGKFTLLCEYGEIISSKSIIVSSDVGDQFYLYKIIEPYPTFEEYDKGDEFEEGDLISVHSTWEDAHKAQRKQSP